ncbi:MAG: hypothetical protein ACLP01_25825 [Solirubrobacteraceae bacterium]
MQLQDGKVIDGTAFYDSISFNELWTRVKPSNDPEACRVAAILPLSRDPKLAVAGAV